MKTHELKTHIFPFEAIKKGRKNFEFRKNDRDFNEGDTVVLKEFLPNLAQYSGDEITAKVGYVLKGPAFFVPEGYCCFALLDVKRNGKNI